jgi:hypothetical protein
MSSGPEKAEPTAQQRTLATVASDQYNNYMTNYRPFEDKYQADVMGDTTARTAKVTGRANADVAQSAGAAIKPGVDPTSGRAFSEVADTAPATAKSKAIVKGTQAVENQQVSAEQGIVNMGQGKAATTQAGISDLASNASGRAISDARLRVNNDAFTSNTIGSAVGGVAGMARTSGAIKGLSGGLSNMSDGLNFDGTMTSSNADQWAANNPGFERD